MMLTDKALQEQLSFLRENHFHHTTATTWQQLPIIDEPFVQTWEKYIKDIARDGFMATLSTKLVKLNFPVQTGLSQNPNCQWATKRGTDTSAMPEATGVRLQEPERIKVYLYQTLAGRVPVLEIKNRPDFVTTTTGVTGGAWEQGGVLIRQGCADTPVFLTPLTH